uniref:CCHC-type domain-containing protein n=1 Tax=Electrophorus electricus TaxID=8005 RepID=A0A4W4DZX0_ELEEL
MNNGECFICDQLGHWSRNCPELTQGEYTSHQQTSFMVSNLRNDQE